MIEVETPADRSARRGRRAVVAATIAALIAGTAGFLLGRSTDETRPGVGAVPSTVATTDAPAITMPGGTTPSSAAPEPVPTTVLAPPLGSADTKSAAGSGVYAPGAYEEPPMELVGQRTTASGVVLKAYLGRYEGGDPYFGGPPGWAPAAWCFPQGNLRISIVAPTSVNIAYASWYPELKDGLSVTTFASGYVEGSPIFGAVAQVDSDVTSISMSTESGLTDTTEPTNGIALLQVDGGIEANVTFTVTKADGTSSVKQVSDLAQPYVTAEFHEACDPPGPALPEAGGQPDDPVAAEDAIRANWVIVHNFAGDTQSRRSFVDDDTGVVDAWKALQEGEYADAASESTADIKELVFTAPTEAWFRYDLLTPITNFYDRYGVAHLDSGGTWVFTRQTICQDISLAPGFGCTPPVDQLLPPSAATDPRYSPQLINEGDIVGD
jgi:hypothetical protein